MSELTIFSFQDDTSNAAVDVRTIVDQHGEPWFVLRDVLAAMGSKTTVNNAKDSIIKGLGDGYSNGTPILDSLGRQQDATIISEPAVTFLVSRSNTERGRRLNRWIHAEVLPAIRKTGSYSVQPSTGHLDVVVRAAQMAPSMVEAAKAFGFEGNQATLSANRVIVRFTSVDLLDAMGQKALVSPDQDVLLTPTDIANRMHIKGGARAVNDQLIDCGLQTRHRDLKNSVYYELTEEGKRCGVMLDVGKYHSNGTPIRQLKWRSSVMDVLNARFEVEEEGAY